MATKPPTRASRRGSTATVPSERANFRKLLLANPNYFGQYQKGPSKPVVQIQGNTDYEELGCIGFQPQFSRLEAVVFIKRSTGYGGNICTAGTPEYVRFYLSFDNGASWQDQGMSSFTAYDVAEKERLEFDVSLRINPPREFCFFENLPLVRAILSWNNPPPPNAPGWTPIWGNVKEGHIQVGPRSFALLSEILEQSQLGDLKAALDPQQQVPVAQPKELSPTELYQLYKGKKVPGHRFLSPQVQQLADQPIAAASPPANLAAEFAGIDENISSIVNQIIQTNGNTTYEQLDCVGFNPGADTLAGTITVKLPNGYSGGPCTAGSREYVAFWVDWGDGAGFTYAGTTSVNVHDIAAIPKDGLHYAVFLPANSLNHRQPCKEGPRTARVRAILSWQVPPPPGDPNYVPTWGNREETLILLAPGDAIPVDTHIPFLSSVGDMPEIDINSIGTSNGTTIHTGFAAVDSPFGGRISLAGHIAYPIAGLKYRVMRKPNGAPDSAYAYMIESGGVPLTLNTFNIITGWHQSPLTVFPDPQGYYPYEDYSFDHSIEGSILFYWESTLGEDGNTYDIRIDLSVDGNPAHDLHSNVVTVLVDNQRPDVSLDIALGGGVQCADFHPGDTFAGHYHATDAHFCDFSFIILPSGPAHGKLPTVSAANASQLSNHYLGGTIADPGVLADNWSLNTTGMDPCGYSLTLYVRDRTNVNSGATNYDNQTSVGFCLLQPGD